MARSRGMDRSRDGGTAGRRRACAAIGLAALVLPAIASAGLAQTPGAAPATIPAAPPRDGGASGLALPRYVSLKPDRVNVRQGPGTDHRIAWVFQQAGLPVEVIAESDAWRQVRDSEGATGWVYHGLLSARRTVLVAPWTLKGAPPADGTAGGEGPAQIDLKMSRSTSASALAVIEAGVIGNVRQCDGTWCEIVVGTTAGFVEQKRLWGVYDGETVK